MDIRNFVLTADQARAITPKGPKIPTNILNNTFAQIEKQALRGLREYNMMLPARKFATRFTELLREHGYSVEMDGKYRIKITW